MIIARGTLDDNARTGSELLILGLSDRNVAALLAGKPMRITRETHGEGIPEGWSIMIFHGKTEEDCALILKEAGAIGSDTKVINEPKLNKS